MSLMADPDDYATTCKRYADSVVSIFRGGRLFVVDNGHASERTGHTVTTFGSNAVDKYRHFAMWLVHTISLSLVKLLPAPCLNQERSTLDLPSWSPHISLEEPKLSVLFNTSTSET